VEGKQTSKLYLSKSAKTKYEYKEETDTDLLIQTSQKVTGEKIPL
jgi:hypothetical protein